MIGLKAGHEMLPTLCVNNSLIVRSVSDIWNTRDNIKKHHEERSAMNTGGDIDQFQALEQKIDSLIEMITTLKKEKEAFSEKFFIQEEKLADLSKQIEGLKAGRDNAKQKIISLLEKIEQVEI